jgi:hypothetical protein
MPGMDNAIDMVDAQICWECAETRPVFAHQTCQQLDRIVGELKEME